MEKTRLQFIEELEKLMLTAKDKAPGDLLFTYKGVLYPSIFCSPETFQKLENFEARKDDLMLIAYPKCGTNWILQIVTEMVCMHANKSPSGDIPVIEFGSAEKLERLEQQPSPRVITTHLYLDNIPKSFFKTKTKKLVIFRNPKDTAVSYFHFSNNNPSLPTYSSWDDFFQHFMSGKVSFGSYFEYMLAWNEHLDDEDVMIITFEDMKENLVAGVKQIAEFFGYPLTQDQIQEIANRGTFQSMKTKSQETYGQFGQVLFRKGDIGDWKEHFSPAQSEEMDASFNKYIAGTKLGAKMKYDVYCKA
ncbi:sulfotransferase 6B1-like [Rhinatrema bivittatum]|uniref:sulfotransferase 6B1-like n=1 Tax=Rhinatrema bivittatum TaxID=194408 RepID=UPI0011285D2B|nr:sulfotransferase 6B1-like [Rhinatrema bivittatum]